ncbi:MAG: AsmA family protein [Pseudomonadota bacterium]
MKRWFRPPVLGLKTKILLGVGLAVALTLAVFDWNWLRPWLERHLSENSQRVVTIGDLEVELGFSFEPTVRLRSVYIENAPWADTKRPMAVAGEASFTFALNTLWDERRVVSRIVLKDAEVDLEWLPDGLRNWRLREPDYRGPGRYKVLALETHRTSIRFARPGIDLDVVGASTRATQAEPGGESVAPPAPALSTRIDFNGKYRGAAFAGAVLTSELLTLQETGRSFPLQGHMTFGKTRFDADGTVADLLKRTAIDARIRASGPSLAALRPFFDVHFVSHPYRADARLRKNDNDYAVEQLQAKIGATDIAGELSYRDGKDGEGSGRPLLRATLRSESADLADLGVVGRPAAKEAGAERMFPRNALGAESIKTIDAHVSFVARKLKSAAMPALESLKFSADLDDGILQLKPIDLGVAGGHAIGAITFDAKREPPSSQMAIDFRGVRLDQLLPALASKGVSPGAVSANLKLSGRGNSIAAIAGNASGSMSMKMAGGRISNLLDAKLGLNLGKMLRLTISGDRAIDVHCAAIAFDFNNGLGKSRAILLDTEQTRIDGNGTMNLRDETLDVLLYPTQKKPGLFSLHSAFRVQGALQRPVFALDKNAAPRTVADQKHVQCP